MKSSKIEIRVTQEHIDKGTTEGHSCPIALAFKELFPYNYDTFVSVGQITTMEQNEYLPIRKFIKLPWRATMFVIRHDKAKSCNCESYKYSSCKHKLPKPFTFKVKYE